MSEKQQFEVVLATHNAGKVRELANDLAPLGWNLRGLADFGIVAPEETGVTFEENAQLKAANAAAKTGLWALADDSGLEVDALGGVPGVQTADFGGWEKLLEVMKHLPTEPRTARFRCVLALVRAERETLFFKGVCEGVITSQGRGDGGFGYDPVFQPVGEALTFAEMSKGEKSALSHRGEAVRALLTWVASEEAL